MSKLYLFFILILTGCATIRQPTVQLSAEVGSRISEMQKLHVLTLQRYFDAERQKVDAFLKEKWEPLYLKNFLGQSGVLEQLNAVSFFDDKKKEELQLALSAYLTDSAEANAATQKLIKGLDQSRQNEPDVVRQILRDYVEDNQLNVAVSHINSLLGTDERARIILEFAEVAHEQMMLQRNDMVAPIDQMQRVAMAELSAAYSDLAAAQALITARLDAAAKIKSEQDYLLSALGVKETTDIVAGQLSKLSSAVDTEILHAQLDEGLDKIKANFKNEVVKILDEARKTPETKKQ